MMGDTLAGLPIAIQNNKKAVIIIILALSLKCHG